MQHQSATWQDFMHSCMRSLKKKKLPSTLFHESKLLYKKKKKKKKDKSFHGP